MLNLTVKFVETWGGVVCLYFLSEQFILFLSQIEILIVINL